MFSREAAMHPPQALHNQAPAAIAADEPSQPQLLGVAMSFAGDETVFRDGNSADVVYRVMSGVVRTVQTLADGRRQILEFFFPGDMFGLELANDRPIAAEAVLDTVLIATRRTNLLAEPSHFCRYSMRALERSYQHVVTLGRRSASERVAAFLTDLDARIGAAGLVELPMSRQDIGDYLGLTIETVSRTFTQLQASGLIEARGRRVRLRRAAVLAAMVE
jgi:CRP/FNR family transcriptional regulator, nitrogen fixation regulation protein